MKYIFIILLLQFNTVVFGQQLTSEILSLEKNRQLSRGLADITEQLLFIGEYNKALQMRDIADYLRGDFLTGYKIPDSTLNKNNEYTLLPAKKYIIEKSKTEKIIIINEAHHQPLHRAFTASLLKELYLNGYRYLAVETLSEDSLLNIDKYPKKTSGYYTSEPRYGNLIREALSIGYKLIDYERHREGDWHEREYEQANNIKKKIFDRDPNAKVLVHCGYGHGIEILSGPDTLMGGWVKVLTGIDPLTINQVTLTEHSKPEYENDCYKTLKNDSASVFVNKGSLYNLYLNGFAQEYDIEIYHPRTRYMAGRPNWLNISGEKKHYFPTDDKRIIIYQYHPIIIQAFVQNEDITTAVPADCIELLSQEEKKALVLNPGKYTLLIRDKKNKEQRLEIEVK